MHKYDFRVFPPVTAKKLANDKSRRRPVARSTAAKLTAPMAAASDNLLHRVCWTDLPTLQIGGLLARLQQLFLHPHCRRANEKKHIGRNANNKGFHPSTLTLLNAKIIWGCIEMRKNQLASSVQ